VSSKGEIVRCKKCKQVYVLQDPPNPCPECGAAIGYVKA